MTRRTAALFSCALLGLAACGAKTTTVVEECGEGMGRADDGICYPLAGADDAGTTDATEDSGASDAGSGDGGSGSGSGSGDDAGSGSGSGDDAGSGADGGDPGTGGDAGTGGDGGPIGGSPITISGVIDLATTTESGANCNISSWVIDAIDEGTGEPDRSAYSENDLQFIDCADHAGGPLEYSLEIEVDTSAEVAFFAFVDPDGDSSTTDYRAGSEANPITVEEGGTYTDIDFVLTAD